MDPDPAAGLAVAEPVLDALVRGPIGARPAGVTVVERRVLRLLKCAN